jgi:hypothetical protein
MRRMALLVVVFALALVASAQNDTLQTEDTEIFTQLDAFGLERGVARGTVVNASDEAAFADVQVIAEVYDADDNLIGEGVGFLVNQCDKNVPLDYVLGPEREQRFVAPLDLFEPDAEVERINYSASGREVAPAEGTGAVPVEGITPVSTREVARVEWWTTDADGEETEPRLLYGEGCYRDVFTSYDWYEYNPAEDSTQEIEHPRAEVALSADFQEDMDLVGSFTNEEFEAQFNRSGLTFEPSGRERGVFQTDINTLITTEFDGGFRRMIDDQLFRSTLQGINWVNQGRFIAYYYGAYGDGVTYLVASVDAAYYSTPERFSTPSVTIPEVTPNIGGVIVSGTFNNDETPGFYVKVPSSEFYTRWFEWENLPGNNYPAPVYRSRGGAQPEDVVYFALPDENDQPRLHCYDRREGTLHDLAPLPFELGTEDRAYMTLSPDGTQIALGTNGVNGGVWLLDLDIYDVCVVEYRPSSM